MELPTIPSFRLDGKRALVSGAGRGIGLAAASALAEAGAEVTLVARSGEEIAAAAAAIAARGRKAQARAIDVTDLEAVRAWLAAPAPFDILFNNAGTNRPAPFVEVSVEEARGGASIVHRSTRSKVSPRPWRLNSRRIASASIL